MTLQLAPHHRPTAHDPRDELGNGCRLTRQERDQRGVTASEIATSVSGSSPAANVDNVAAGRPDVTSTHPNCPARRTFVDVPGMRRSIAAGAFDAERFNPPEWVSAKSQRDQQPDVAARIFAKRRTLDRVDVAITAHAVGIATAKPWTVASMRINADDHRRWCADAGRPTRFKPSSPSPTDAVRDGSAKLGHPVQNVTREHGLTPLPR